VGLEACPLSEWLRRHLVAAGFKAVCVETRHAQRFLSTRPVKTDKNDARGIAEMMRVGPKPWSYQRLMKTNSIRQ
jgi:transposase